MARPTRSSVLLLTTAWLLLAAGAAQAAPPRADLRVPALAVVPASSAAGGTVVVRETTANRGRRTARATRTAYLLSRDARRSADDRRLLTRPVRGLRAGATSKGARRVVVPARTVPGAYRLLACADVSGRVRERSERDNCRGVALRVTGAVAIAPPIALGAGGPGGTGAGSPGAGAAGSGNAGGGPAVPGPAGGGGGTTTPTAPGTGATPVEPGTGPAPSPDPPPPAPDPTPATDPPPPPATDPPPPAAPVLTGTRPASGADTPTTRVRGRAPGGAPVELFVSEVCAGRPVATGTLEGDGLAVPVAQGATTTFTARVPGDGRPCSAPLTFEEVPAVEVEPNGTLREADIVLRDHGLRFGRGLAGLRGTFDGRDTDLLAVDAAAPLGLRVRLDVPPGGPCPTLQVLGDTGEPLGPEACGTLEVSLPAGFAYLRLAGVDAPWTLTVQQLPGVLLQRTVPAGGQDPSPELVGTATPAGTVTVFAGSACAGPPLATGTPEALATAGLTVPAEADAVNLYSAHASLGGTTGPCTPPIGFAHGAEEVEPNGSTQDAEANPRLTLPAVRRGAKEPIADQIDALWDRFAVDLPAAVTLQVEVSADGVGCTREPLILRVRQAGEVVFSSEVQCSHPMRVPLEPGTALVELEGAPRTPVPWTLHVREVPEVTVTATTPADPGGADTTPVVRGTATAGSQITLFTGADCTGGARATGDAARFAGEGIAVAVAPNSVRRLSARATLRGLETCSTTPVVYGNDAGRPAPTVGEGTANEAPGDGTALLAPGALAGGTLASSTDVDWFRVTGPTTLRFELTDSTAATCRGALQLLLQAPSGTTSEPSTGDQRAGINGCATLVRDVPAGTTHVRVSSATGTTMQYRLRVTAPARTAVEAEPNDVPGDAQPLGAADVLVTGALASAQDADWYAVDVAEGRTLRVRVVEPGTGSAERCTRPGAPGTMATRLSVVGPQGEELALRSGRSRSGCAIADGFGVPGDDALWDLPAGRYRVRVAASDEGPGDARALRYRLDVETR